MVLSLVHPLVQVYTLPRIGQLAYVGHVCNFRQNVARFFTSLPVLPQDMPFVMVRPRTLRNRVSKKMPFKVNVDKFRAAFLWLHKNNPLYAHTKWDESSAHAWSDEDVAVKETEVEHKTNKKQRTDETNRDLKKQLALTQEELDAASDAEAEGDEPAADGARGALGGLPPCPCGVGWERACVWHTAGLSCGACGVHIGGLLCDAESTGELAAEAARSGDAEVWYGPRYAAEPLGARDAAAWAAAAATAAVAFSVRRRQADPLVRGRSR